MQIEIGMNAIISFTQSTKNPMLLRNLLHEDIVHKNLSTVVSLTEHYCKIHSIQYRSNTICIQCLHATHCYLKEERNLHQG